ncbi:hypothetical protein FAEPRAM212_02846 [Faecalibacterium prausnitzii M21/2]|uniref:Uncharacterized protein n=1 Tax=Faecalibacterium prausnitzii M21/2 TaxID=411485 RepID=A8SFT5_9FIRM|nr:hypothetical protein FAEPRAM212_02846 [Faecalibacterium prausnitzii M21/2]
MRCNCKKHRSSRSACFRRKQALHPAVFRYTPPVKMQNRAARSCPILF